MDASSFVAILTSGMLVGENMENKGFVLGFDLGFD